MPGKRNLKILSGTLFVIYPFLIYFGISRWGARPLTVMLSMLFLLRVAATPAAERRGRTLISLLLIVLLFIAFLTNDEKIVFFMPALINLLLLGAFMISIIHPPSVIERFARLSNPDLPLRAIEYCRKVTIVWCGFFLLNGAIALLSAICWSREFWVFYNGFFSYLLIGALMLGEYLVRPKYPSDAP